jgi:hypothetical protein
MTDAHAPGAYDGRGRDSPQWWPSRYGAEDELGAGNELTPERAMAALKIPKEGRVIHSCSSPVSRPIHRARGIS